MDNGPKGCVFRLDCLTLITFDIRDELNARSHILEPESPCVQNDEYVSA